MLRITVTMSESFDEEKQEFLSETFDLELEHSLVSVSKWESIWEKPFLVQEDKTPEEVFSYIECMILNPDPPPEIVYKLSERDLKVVHDHIASKATATWFNEQKVAGRSSETFTSELIYFWMSSFAIPFEAENWHLSRLLTLIRIHNVKNQKPKKMNRNEMAAQRRAENERRKKALGTTG
jgi:hypothetical protein